MSEHFGELVKQARLKKDLSLRDLENQGVGISYSYISKLEKGQYFPSRQVVTNLATALDIPLDTALISAGYSPKEFVQRVGRGSRIAEEPEQHLHPDIRKIARAGEKMTPEQREQWLKMAKVMFPEAFTDE